MKSIQMYSHVISDVLTLKHFADQKKDIIDELNQLAIAFDMQKDTYKVLDNPTLGNEFKSTYLGKLANSINLSPFALKLLKLLSSRCLVGSLSKILIELNNIEVEKRGGIIGSIASAEPLTAESVQQVEAVMSQKIDKKVSLIPVLEPNLIAGIKVVIGGVTYDGSVRSKLNQILVSV